jgi:hypothetical protein
VTDAADIVLDGPASAGLAAESYLDRGDRPAFVRNQNVIHLDYGLPDRFIAERGEADGFAPLVLRGAEI